MTPTLISHKLLFIVIAIFLAILVMTGTLVLVLGGKKQKLPENITLTVWGFEDESVYQKTIDVFLQTHPNTKVIYRVQNPNKYLERIRGRQQSTREGERPDIFIFHNTWVSEVSDLLAVAPADVIVVKRFQQLFYPAAVHDLIISDAIIGVPTSADNLALYYNKDLLAAKNITPPKDWEAFSQAAVRLTTRDDNGTPQTAGAAIGTANNITYFSDILGAMFAQQATTPAKLGDQETNSIVEYYAGDITRFAKGQERIWDPVAFESDIDAFAKGKVAMIFAPAIAARDIIKKNPSLSFATSTIPQLRPNEPQTLASYWAWGIGKRSANPRLAWQLALKLTEQAALIRANSAYIKLYSVGLPYPRKDMALRQKNDPILGTFVSQADIAASLPVTSQAHDGAKVDQVVQILRDAVTQRQTRGIDYNQVGAQIQEALKGK